MNTENSRLKNQTIKEYQTRINKVIDYIENNLGSELTLETLSSVACFSSFHFHRLFHSFTGDTPANYIKKRRLISAANKMYRYPDTKISHIAYEFGFSGQSDFSRSFKAFFKITPTAFMESKHKNKCLALPLTESAQNTSPTQRSEYEKNINIRRLDDYTVAYIRNSGLSKEHRNGEIESSFRKLYTWASVRDLINNDTVVMGVTLDNPEIVSLEECRHDTCLTLSQTAEPDGNIGIRRLNTKGRYAAFRFDSEDREFSKTFFQVINYIYGCWMPENGFFPEDKPCVELYGKDSVNGHIYIELLIPIRPS